MRHRLRTATVAATLALTLAATGCGIRSEPTGALAPPITVRDGAGRTVTVSRIPRRIVSLDAGVTEWLFAVGAGRRVVGRAGGERYPGAARRVPVVQGGVADPAAIRARRPDLVIAPAATPASTADALSARLHVPVYVPDGSDPRAIEHDALSVSALAGESEAASALVGQVQRGLARVGREAAALPAVRVFVDRGAFYTITEHQLGHALLGIAGGIDVAAGASADAPYPLARLGRAAPEAYLALRGSGTTLQKLRARPATRNLPAVRSGDFHQIPAAQLTDTGPRIVTAVERLAQTLHPGALRAE